MLAMIKIIQKYNKMNDLNKNINFLMNHLAILDINLHHQYFNEDASLYYMNKFDS